MTRTRASTNYVVELRPVADERDPDGRHRLRRLLKVAGRTLGLRAVSVHEQNHEQQEGSRDAQPRAST